MAKIVSKELTKKLGIKIPAPRTYTLKEEQDLKQRLTEASQRSLETQKRHGQREKIGFGKNSKIPLTV